MASFGGVGGLLPPSLQPRRGPSSAANAELGGDVCHYAKPGTMDSVSLEHQEPQEFASTRSPKSLAACGEAPTRSQSNNNVEATLLKPSPQVALGNSRGKRDPQ